ncbi:MULTISPECIES: carbohydrate ABC transporter permease [unclassified Halomonas]|uniref:carbohydrate ABC transporter permease n=1 Tax=unclassified Halomonas TaxID=2609666 RepID=UPI0007D90E27|nr:MULTISPECIES: carbohydrate ABC transporter permease [unclassified Halomonas]MBT2786093.1 carbohydrate ABC transporter permease [Halomonas sp. ISL-106]MBT2797115.1 carbohydrate ABC transporter permease [Halomonas sp. ISL-104]OAL58498.1 ABC transporter permease [Halomonas sp. ALS9]
MNPTTTYTPYTRYVFIPSLETVAAWLLAIIWIFPLLYAFWAAFHPSEFMVNFEFFAPLTLENFINAWSQAPFAHYYLNTFALVTGVVIGQFIVCTLAAFAFARFPIPGKNVLFMLVLIQLFVFPEVLIVENYRIASELGLINTITGIGLPYVASALGIFLLRQTFKTIPQELEDAARIEGCNWLEILWKVYVPLAKPTYLAYGLVSISHHWNNFIWPLVVTNSVESRPLTVGLGVFSAPETGVNWATVSAATLLSIAPLLVAFLLFQRQFVQSFLRAGIR